MALNAADRKILSKKYVDIPDENINFSANIAGLDLLITEFQNKDVSFKGLFDADNNIINLYHPEINLLVGHIRTSVLEQNVIDSANKVLGNFFFPNNNATPTPGLPDGIWKQLKAYSKNIAVGKTYGEVYTTQDSETVKMSAVTALTASIAADYSVSERQTGAPDVPPPPPFDLAIDLSALEAAVNVWELWLTNQKSALQSNTDPKRTAQTAAAIADINLSLADIVAWEALTSFDVGGKVDDPGLQILNDEIARRAPAIASRIAEIDTRLGSITQNPDGSVSAFSGLYGARYVNLDSRANLAEGTLTKQKSFELGKRVQTENISNNNNYLQYLKDNVLKANKLAADPNGSNDITLIDATDFSIANSVFIVSETQTELTGTITNKVGNVITLSFTVPATFTVGDVARLGKEV